MQQHLPCVVVGNVPHHDRRLRTWLLLQPRLIALVARCKARDAGPHRSSCCGVRAETRCGRTGLPRAAGAAGALLAAAGALGRVLGAGRVARVGHPGAVRGPLAGRGQVLGPRELVLAAREPDDPAAAVLVPSLHDCLLAVKFHCALQATKDNGRPGLQHRLRLCGTPRFHCLMPVSLRPPSWLACQLLLLKEHVLPSQARVLEGQALVLPGQGLLAPKYFLW
mmetsp:Transcript_39440/g.112602  ORF Transcript_39440/g.112602 Transcript_39440/m.112602 type:complete len:223 (+) Transcript_39440:489-1157(+)